MNFITKFKKKEQGFASFEFAWSAFVLTWVIFYFMSFYQDFQKKVTGLIQARHEVFEKIPAGAISGGVVEGEENGQHVYLFLGNN